MSEFKLTIDGQQVTVPPGSTIMNAAKKLGIEIPKLCFHKGLSNPGACRMCVVEVENARNLQASCVSPVADGMIVKTESERVITARKHILQLYMANHDMRCWTCEANGDCALQTYIYYYGIDTTPFRGKHKDYPIYEDNPFFIRDYNKCILCGKCVRICTEINGVQAVQFTDRGFTTKVTSAFDDAMADTTCTFCGMCVQVCPVGALVFKNAKRSGRPWEVHLVKTTCSYCGVGCQLNLKIKDDKIVGVIAEDVEPNKGHLCVKGQFGWEFVHSPDRLTQPLIQKDGELQPASWDEAIKFIATKLMEIKEKHGGKSLAGLSSAKCTCEENFLFQKLMRSVLSTNHVDHCARL